MKEGGIFLKRRTTPIGWCVCFIYHPPSCYSTVFVYIIYIHSLYFVVTDTNIVTVLEYVVVVFHEPKLFLGEGSLRSFCLKSPYRNTLLDNFFFLKNVDR